MTFSMRLLTACPKGLSRLKGMETYFPDQYALYSYTAPSERTFPFEGEWKHQRGVPSVSTAPTCPKGLSRLKGMETRKCKRQPQFPEAQTSERTFPLEGNGNLSRGGVPSDHMKMVRKDFPVGREWKLLFPDGRESLRFSPKGLSRWKGMETGYRKPGTLRG